jgi:dTDP-glucose 4,6-dehydratase
MDFHGKKVLVTGAGGFIGSHLAERLVEAGAHVRAFVRYNSRNDWGWLDRSTYKDAIEVITGDIRDFDSVNAAVMGADIIMHLAALIGIPYSYVSPLAYIRTNVEGTYNVLQAARQNHPDIVVVTSTSEVYGTARKVPITEEHPFQPQSPYSASKISADNMAMSFFLSFGLPVVIARPFNTYGPRQSARAVVPTVITQILAGMKEIKLGATHPTRDLNFVRDTAEGFIALAGTDAAVGKAVNICSSKEISIGALANLIKDVMGAKSAVIEDHERIRPEKSEVERLLGDGSLLESLTGWRPSVGLREGIEETVRWFDKTEHMSFYKPDIYNV